MRRSKKIICIILVILLLPGIYLLIHWVPTSMYHSTRDAAIRYNARAFGLMVPPAYAYNGIREDVAEIPLDTATAIYVFLDEENTLVLGRLQQRRGKYKLEILLQLAEDAQQAVQPRNVFAIDGITYLCTFSDTPSAGQSSYEISAWGSFLTVAQVPDD